MYKTVLTEEDEVTLTLPREYLRNYKVIVPRGWIVDLIGDGAEEDTYTLHIHNPEVDNKRLE